jgi:hypothetical protein
MITAQNAENSAGIWVNAFFGLFDPCSVYTDSNIVFTLAGHCTRVTADTLSVVDDKSVLH